MATLVQAVRLALHYGETHLGVTDIFGEDVGPPLGGVFTATQGLKTAWNTPLDERGIIGMAMGIAYAGGRHDALRFRHPRQSLSFTFVRELRQPPARLENRHAEQRARCLWTHALG